MTQKRLAYLGPAGTFSEEAAISYDPNAERVVFPSIPQVTLAIESGAVTEAIVPIENSQQGSIPDVLDFLIRTERTKICHEMALAINNCLMIRPGTDLSSIQIIYSHPQPLGQCRRYLASHFPEVKLIAALSTAGAVRDMMQSDVPAAAVAPARSAEIYGAEVVARGIQDRPNNFTRFVVLSDHDHDPTGEDKTSIAFSFDKDGPGLLYAALGAFATRNVNLTKIESRPSGEQLGRYIFLADIEGHRADTVIVEALNALRGIASNLKIFGSYPRSIRVPPKNAEKPAAT